LADDASARLWISPKLALDQDQIAPIRNKQVIDVFPIDRQLKANRRGLGKRRFADLVKRKDFGVSGN
jgi:hypothetical protein